MKVEKDEKKDVASKDTTKDSKDSKDAKDGKEVVKEVKDADTLTFEDIKENVRFLERGVQTKESRYVTRVLRTLFSTRKKLNDNVLKRVITSVYVQAQAQNDKEFLMSFISNEQSMETDQTEVSSTVSNLTSTSGPIKTKQSTSQNIIPEVDLFIHLLVLLFSLDQKKVKESHELVEKMMEKILSYNRRTLDAISSKCYFYYARVYELVGRLDQIRPLFHARLRTSILHNDFESVATLINCLLRSYLHYNLFDQAQKLVSKSTFPLHATNNEWARHLFYLGRIKATQLEYSEAHKNLLQALRKAPQNEAVGFKQTIQKFALVVELLLGEIPDKATFRNPQFKKTLQPYFQLTQAVRTGNLARFNQVLDQFGEKFKKEKTWTLIIRLRHNVIKTGVKMISLSYSKISLESIAQKLQLDSAVDAEFIVAKAIRDGVIEAHIEHEAGYVQTKDLTDIYSTLEPMKAFNQRIEFCLNLRNQSVKAMRFPPKKYSEELETAEERRAREEEELEYAKEMADEEDDGFA